MMDVRLAALSLSTLALLGAVLLMGGVAGQMTSSQPMSIRSALLTKNHTAAPTPPFRVCPCSSRPCHNGGRCMNRVTGMGGTAVPGFTCACMDEWQGDVCHICNTTLGFGIQCSDICYRRRNDICEDGGSGSVSPSLCTLGTDCEDCNARCL